VIEVGAWNVRNTIQLARNLCCILIIIVFLKMKKNEKMIENNGRIEKIKK